MSTVNEREINPIQEILNLVQHSSNLVSLGFTESFRSNTAVEKQLIYDSEWCRVNFVWGGWDPLAGNTISVYYGRLHAPNEGLTMLFEGQQCYAWHSINEALYFLDGYSPEEAVQKAGSHHLTDKYFEKKINDKFYRRQPKWLMTMHMEIWDHYGRRFFELFDLRRPDLWEQYRKFLKGFYDIEGRIPFIKPPLDKVC